MRNTTEDLGILQSCD